MEASCRANAGTRCIIPKITARSAVPGRTCQWAQGSSPFTSQSMSTATERTSGSSSIRAANSSVSFCASRSKRSRSGIVLFRSDIAEFGKILVMAVGRAADAAVEIIHEIR